MEINLKPIAERQQENAKMRGLKGNLEGNLNIC